MQEVTADDRYYMDYLKEENKRLARDGREEEITRLKDRIFELQGEVTKDIED